MRTVLLAALNVALASNAFGTHPITYVGTRFEYLDRTVTWAIDGPERFVKTAVGGANADHSSEDYAIEVDPFLREPLRESPRNELPRSTRRELFQLEDPKQLPERLERELPIDRYEFGGVTISH